MVDNLSNLKKRKEKRAAIKITISVHSPSKERHPLTNYENPCLGQAHWNNKQPLVHNLRHYRVRTGA